VHSVLFLFFDPFPLEFYPTLVLQDQLDRVRAGEQIVTTRGRGSVSRRGEKGRDPIYIPYLPPQLVWEMSDMMRRGMLLRRNYSSLDPVAQGHVCLHVTNRFASVARQRGDGATAGPAAP
jgi:hypothetical protein